MAAPMNPPSDRYDELPYNSFPVEWSAPERLALTSLFHGGPRLSLQEEYRVLELGCGNGANLLPLAYYRRNATFVGVDGARTPIEIAQRRKSALELANVDFIHADFLTAAQPLSGRFDCIIAHGVFSWVSPEVRDALLQLCARCLRLGGLLYLNYNTRPGWDVRGRVREFLLAQTAAEAGLGARARHAREVAARVVSALTPMEHHWSQLLANEFRLVAEGDVTWVAHEFLADENYAFWRSEFLALARRHGLEYVADADFNCASGRIPEDLERRLDNEHITGRSIDDTVDLFCYRQLHSPILTPAPFVRRLPDSDEFGSLRVASCLEPCPPRDDAPYRMFRHPSGYEVEAREEIVQTAFTKLRPLWPRGQRIADLFPDVSRVMDDLKLLHRNGLIELQCLEPGNLGVEGDALNRLERSWGGYFTSPSHQVCREVS